MFEVTPGGLIYWKKPHYAGLTHMIGYSKGLCALEENTMVFLTIEASKPNGVSYRLVLGCYLLPLASWITIIGRLL